MEHGGRNILDEHEVRATAEQFIRQEMRDKYSYAKDESIDVESIEIDIKYLQMQRLSYLVQAIATERISREYAVKQKGLINRLLRRRERLIKSHTILGNVVRFQLRIDSSSGKVLAADSARGKGGALDPFFDMRRI